LSQLHENPRRETIGEGMYDESVEFRIVDSDPELHIMTGGGARGKKRRKTKTRTRFIQSKRTALQNPLDRKPKNPSI
jgi:hypothetical protein